MIGDDHCLVAERALACLPAPERAILAPRWEAIEAGATLSDHFRVFWEPELPGDAERQLVHRCWVDSEDPKDHGCVTRALDHAAGSVSFINDYLAGELEGAYSEVEFLENLGMFLGVASHHIADLCTPVHVGHVLDVSSLGVRSWPRFHRRVERDIHRYGQHARRTPLPPTLVELDRAYFWQIARDTYEHGFLGLETLYRDGTTEGLVQMAERAITSAVDHTAAVWHTVLASTAITGRAWTSEPL